MFSLPTFDQIFDPVRALMVEGKILDWFSYRGSFRHLNCSCIQLIFTQNLASISGFAVTLLTG
jgi:hypothetical protein